MTKSSKKSRKTTHKKTTRTSASSARKTKSRRTLATSLVTSLVTRNSDSPISPNALVSCAICDRRFPRDDMLVPSACPGTMMPGTRRFYGERAHRICKRCWWPKRGKPNTGFAREDGTHKCPGCERVLPPTAPLKRSPVKEEDIIVISD